MFNEYLLWLTFLVLPVTLAISSPLPRSLTHRAHFLTSYHSPTPSSPFSWGQFLHQDLIRQLQVAKTEPHSEVSGPLTPPRPLTLPRFFSHLSEMWLCLPLYESTSRPTSDPTSDPTQLRLSPCFAYRFLPQSSTLVSVPSTPITILPPECAVWNVTGTRALLAFNPCMAAHPLGKLTALDNLEPTDSTSCSCPPCPSHTRGSHCIFQIAVPLGNHVLLIFFL